MPPDREAALRRARGRGAGAGAVLLAGLATLGLLFPGRSTRPGPGEYAPGRTGSIPDTLSVLESFVERTRGLTFTGPIQFSVTDAATLARIAAEALPAPDGVHPPDRHATERALHLDPTSTPAAPGVHYSPARHALFLVDGPVDGPVDAATRAGLVRELTRALDDQRFGLRALTQRAAANLDQARALSALIEGDAARVELAYVGTRPGAEQAQIRQRRDNGPPPTDYPGNARQFTVRYGRPFVTQLAADGGNAAVDGAFRRPPLSTAQILDPRLYTGGTPPATVRPPAVPGPIVDSGSLGRFGLAMVITSGRRVLDAGASASVLGDAYVTFRAGSGHCTWGSIVVAGGAQQQLLTDLRRRVGAAHGLADPFGTDTVRYRSCS